MQRYLVGVDIQVADVDRLFEFGEHTYIDTELCGDVGGQRFDGDGLERLQQHAGERGDGGRGAGENHANIGAHLLGHGDLEEVDVEQLVGDRVAQHFAHNDRAGALLPFHLQVDDGVFGRTTQQVRQHCGIGLDGGGFEFVAVHVGRRDAGAPEGRNLLAEHRARRYL